MDGGEATWSEDQLIPIYRNGHIEDVYWTFGYSPVQDETGKVAGVLVVCHETTEKMKILKKMEMSERHLSQAIEDIKEHEQRKDEFIRMASHELKTPVTSIKAYAQLLLSMVREEGKVGAKDAAIKSVKVKEKNERKVNERVVNLKETSEKDAGGKEVNLREASEKEENLKEESGNEEKDFMQLSLVTINKQVDKLTKLITEMLDLSRIESGQLYLNKETFLLSDLVWETIVDFNRILSSLAGDHHEVLFTRKENCIIYADKDRIAQVINNLLANAVKYSPGTDRIEISMERKKNEQGEDSVWVHVTDYGIGIDPNDQDKIFERFYRVEGRSEQTFPGFGIGLFIANDIISRHGGLLSVKSEKGKGAVFTFSLPIT